MCFLGLTDLATIRALQCALWGYPTEGAYYRDATSTDSMLNIKIPFFAVQAEDDPVSIKQTTSILYHILTFTDCLRQGSPVSGDPANPLRCHDDHVVGWPSRMV